MTNWPRAESAGEITLNSGDCLVAAMGFEERALAGLRRACEASQGFHVGLIRYSPTLAQNRESQFLELVTANNLHVEVFEYDREHPAGMGPTLANYITKFDRAYVDISGMSRLLIVQTLVALIEEKRECAILYSEAETYPPLKDEYERANVQGIQRPSFISSGVFEVAATPELSSVAMLGSAIRLVSFLSFDSSHLSNLVQEVQPTHSNVVRGRSPHARLKWRTGAVVQVNRSIVEMLRGAETHEACTFDYRETLDLLLSLYKQHSTFDRIVVAPTGSKMQAVAIGIVRGFLRDVQVVYPIPREFLEPNRYTEGVKEVFRIPLIWHGME